MIKRAATFLTVGLIALATTAVAPSGSASAAVSKEKIDKINAKIISYGEQHPDDLIGYDDLVFTYTGKHIQVGIPGSSKPLTARQAEKALPKKSLTPSDFHAQAGIPNFKPTIVAAELLGPWPSGVHGEYRITGRWNFPDSWAGQAKPVDIASLSFQGLATCFHLINYSISTFNVSGKNTHLGSLRTSTGGTNGVWNVADGTSGFESQADHGGAGITVQDKCSGKAQDLAAAFDYEANQGGSVVGVGVGWGALNVSYSNPGLTRELGTAPVYFKL
jgi:hypothetical protein